MIDLTKLKKMITAETAADAWWDGLSKKEKDAYIKAHPKSKYAKNNSSKPSPAASPSEPLPYKHYKDALSSSLSKLKATPEHEAWVKTAMSHAHKVGKAYSNIAVGDSEEKEKRIRAAHRQMQNFIIKGPPAVKNHGEPASKQHGRAAEENLNIVRKHLKNAANSPENHFEEHDIKDSIQHHRAAQHMHKGNDKAAFRATLNTYNAHESYPHSNKLWEKSVT